MSSVSLSISLVCLIFISTPTQDGIWCYRNGDCIDFVIYISKPVGSTTALKENIYMKFPTKSVISVMFDIKESVLADSKNLRLSILARSTVHLINALFSRRRRHWCHLWPLAREIAVIGGGEWWWNTCTSRRQHTRLINLTRSNEVRREEKSNQA